MKKWNQFLVRSSSLFVLFICTFGCAKERNNISSSIMDNDTTTVNNDPTSSLDSGFSFLALGDSYTIGQSVAENERFPYLTRQLLDQQGISVKLPRYIAQTGWSTVALQDAIKNSEPLGAYDFVTLLIGVNDQYQHLDTNGYRVRFTQLLEKAISLAGNRVGRVFVLSIPDYSATPYVSPSQKMQVSKEIDAFNFINREITLQHSITYVDITSLTREAVNDEALVASDGLHYSAKEHMLWAEKLAPLIATALR